MALPRVTAAIFVLLLISSIVLLCVGTVAVLGPAMKHGNHVEHDDGTIVNISPNMSFDLKTASGHIEHFQCSERCRVELAHMERHVLIKAKTDIYYTREMNNTLLALDVD